MEKIDKIFILLLLLIVTIGFVYISNEKPLQMDELSSYHHSSNKSFNELIVSNKMGIDWMPISYFLILWIVDQISELNKFTIRIPNLIFIFSGIYFLYLVLIKNFGSISTIIGLSTVLSHSLLFPFILTEARPYALYFAVASFLFYTASNIIERNKFSFSFCMGNFLLPFSFYIGGLFSVLVLLSIFFYSIIYKKNRNKILLSGVTGWILFFIITLPTLLDQLKNTFATISTSKVSTYEIFSDYGTFIYFPFLLFSLFVFSFIINKTTLNNYSEKLKIFISCHSSKITLFISILWLMLPFVLFTISNLTSNNLIKTRYFTPNLITFACLLSFLTYLFKFHIQIKRWVTINYLVLCLCFFIFNSRSLARSFSLNSEFSSLSFLKKTSSPVVTLNMNAAFNISHFFENKVYFVVGGNDFATSLNLFSNNFTTIALKELDTDKFHSQFKKNKEIVFLTGNYLKYDVPKFCHKHGYVITNEVELNTTEYAKAFFLRSTTIETK